MNQANVKNKKLLSWVLVCSLGQADNVLAQQDDQADDAAIAAPSLPASSDESEPISIAIDEVVVTGRSLSASQRAVNERIADSSVTDLLDSETMGRLGDSTVSGALRRIPGLSLVADKFIYIRGLGERYSATSLNGAQIPSPDLTRNVIPLDVFPTSIVQSLRVQKAWSAHLPANFGGGSVDIRTKWNLQLIVDSGI